MNAILFRRACVAVGIMGGMTISQQVSASPFEHAVDASGSGPVVLQYGDHTINSALASNLDVDTYTFTALADDELRIAVSSLTNGLDPQIRLLGPAQTLLRTVACSGTNTQCNTGFDLRLTAPGTYTINISDFGEDEAGAYLIHLDKRTHFAGVGYGSTIREAVNHRSDVDFFAFDGNAGTQADVDIRSVTPGLDPHLEVWNPNGDVLFDSACSGSGGPCTVAATNIGLSLTGRYIVGISDFGADETGEYDLRVNCVLGGCATTIPFPAYVPEPETYLLMLAGLGFSVFVQRRRRRH